MAWYRMYFWRCPHIPLKFSQEPGGNIEDISYRLPVWKIARFKLGYTFHTRQISKFWLNMENLAKFFNNRYAQFRPYITPCQEPELEFSIGGGQPNFLKILVAGHSAPRKYQFLAFFSRIFRVKTRLRPPPKLRLCPAQTDVRPW